MTEAFTDLHTKGEVQIPSHTSSRVLPVKDAIVFIAEMSMQPRYEKEQIDSIPSLLAKSKGFRARICEFLLPADYGHVPHGIHDIESACVGIRTGRFGALCIVGEVCTPELRLLIRECRIARLPLINLTGERAHVLRRYITMQYRTLKRL